MCDYLLFAVLVVVVVLVVAYAVVRAGPGRREGYLIYPYLDLDEPGERGVHYALTPGASDGAAGV